MDRLIRTAWRAFWVGLGASAVLVTQTLLAPAPAPAPTEPPAAPLFAPVGPPAAVRVPKHTDPVLSTIRRCETVANVTRCT